MRAVDAAGNAAEGTAGGPEPRSRWGTVRAAVLAGIAATSLAGTALAGTGTVAAAGATPASAAPVDVGSSVEEVGEGVVTQPRIPYEPPLDDDGSAASPLIPPAAWAPAEGTIGRALGRPTGLDALDQRECAPVTAIHVPGTGETNDRRDPDAPHGRVVSGIGHDLEAAFGDEVRNLYLPYVSDAYLTASYDRSSAQGIAALGELVDDIGAACPDTRFVLTGYSQGSDVIGGWADTVLSGQSEITADRVLAIASFGNPRRGAPVAVGYGTADSGSQGILGPREGVWGVLADRVFEACNAGDYWCDATPEMARIAPAVMRASLNPADRRASWESVETVLGSDALSDPATRRAAGDLVGFLLGGAKDHLRYEDEVGGLPPARAAAVDFISRRITDMR